MQPNIAEIRVIKSYNYKLVLLLGANLFSLAGEIMKHYESCTQSITIEVGLKISRELFKIPLLM